MATQMKSMSQWLWLGNSSPFCYYADMMLFVFSFLLHFLFIILLFFLCCVGLRSRRRNQGFVARRPPSCPPAGGNTLAVLPPGSVTGRGNPPCAEAATHLEHPNNQPATAGSNELRVRGLETFLGGLVALALRRHTGSTLMTPRGDPQNHVGTYMIFFQQQAMP